MAEKVKVKAYYNARQYKDVEVDRNEADAITLRNHLIWHEDNKQKYQYNQLEKDEVTVYSLERWIEDGGDVEDCTAYSMEDDLIMQEEIAERKEIVDMSLEILTQRQREVICLRFFEKKKFDEIALELNLSKSTIQVHLERSLKKMKEFIETCRKTPQKFTLYSEGGEIGDAEQ